MLSFHLTARLWSIAQRVVLGSAGSDPKCWSGFQNASYPECLLPCIAATRKPQCPLSYKCQTLLCLGLCSCPCAPGATLHPHGPVLPGRVLALCSQLCGLCSFWPQSLSLSLGLFQSIFAFPAPCNLLPSPLNVTSCRNTWWLKRG